MKKVVLCSAAMLFSSSLLAMPPACQESGSDPDGDGWGWENNASCMVDNSAGGGGTGGDGISACQNPGVSDPDGDGWGWENNASCRVSGGGGSGGGTSAFSVTGLQSQISGLMASQTWTCGDESSVSNDRYGVDEWSADQWCGASSCGSISTHVITFGADGSYSADVETISRGDTSNENVQGNYSWLNGLNIVIGNQRYNQIGITRIGERESGRDAIYFYSSNDKRFSCTSTTS